MALSVATAYVEWRTILSGVLTLPAVSAQTWWALRHMPA